MSRIETKRPRRPFPALASAAPPVASGLEPGSPRAIARRLAWEGAIQLARQTTTVGSPALGDRAEDDICPLSRRRPTWTSWLPGRAAVAGLALALCSAPVSAQVASASPAALGLGENYTAAARGLDAVAWNPSALGLVGAPGPSFVAMAVRGASGLGPIGLGTIGDWSDALVPADVKQDWLARIRADGGQVGSGVADLTWAAVRVGRVAVHASSSARLTADVSPGVAELVLFGNVGESGQGQSLDLSGSSLTGWAWSTVGASVALPIPTDGGLASIGLTVKYVMGHAMAFGDNSAGATTADPPSVHLSFPLVHTDLEGDFALDRGTGIGLDLGASVETGDWTLSGVVQNLTNSYAWDVSALRYRPLSVSLDRNEARTETADVPLASAPTTVLDAVAGLGFDRVYAAGLAWRYAYDLTFMADVRFTSPDGVLAGPSRHVGAGFEYYVYDGFPLRMGGAAISMGPDADGWQAGAGLGLELGSWSLSASALRRDAGRLGRTTMLMLGLFAVVG